VVAIAILHQKQGQSRTEGAVLIPKGTILKELLEAIMQVFGNFNLQTDGIDHHAEPPGLELDELHASGMKAEHKTEGSLAGILQGNVLNKSAITLAACTCFRRRAKSFQRSSG
jgi:hypothetical protein